VVVLSIVVLVYYLKY